MLSQYLEHKEMKSVQPFVEEVLHFLRKSELAKKAKQFHKAKVYGFLILWKQPMLLQIQSQQSFPLAQHSTVTPQVQYDKAIIT